MPATDLNNMHTSEITIQPTDRSGPIAFASVFASRTAEEAAGDDFARRHELDPEGYFKPGVCRHCGTGLGTALADRVMPMGVLGYLPNVCCPECSQKGKERIAAEAEGEQAKAFSGVVPAEFCTWDANKGNGAALAAAIGKFSFTTRRGMVIHGISGSCKTRIVWELVKRIVEQPQPFSWLVLDSFDAATAGFQVEAAKVDFLFIDDLGNEPTSTKFETALLRLIRKRCDWHKPIFITTQLTGLQFKARFFQGSAGEAIMRRLNERTDKINTAAAT